MKITAKRVANVLLLLLGLSTTLLTIDFFKDSHFLPEHSDIFFFIFNVFIFGMLFGLYLGKKLIHEKGG